MEWTDADVARAAEEGWKRQNNSIVRAYDAHGCCPFYKVADVMMFLRRKGKDSEWHAQAYLSAPWTQADIWMAATEGWMIPFTTVLTRDLTLFKTDEDAHNFVFSNALTGDPLYKKAVATLMARRLLYPEDT